MATRCRPIPIHEYRLPGNAVNDKLLTIVKDRGPANPGKRLRAVNARTRLAM